MSNKTQLQTNNTNLQTVLSNVLGLPTEESCKTGGYVWKKCEYIPATTVSDVTYTNISVSNYTLYITVNSNSYDLTKVNSSFFIGLECTIKQSSSSSSYLKFTITSKTEATQYNAYDGATTTCTYTYDASNKTLTIKPSGSTALSSYTSPYVSSFTFSTDAEESKILLGYVVSDNESAYPDGGMQGGYWYEKASGGGFQIFTGTITPASQLSKFTIPNPFNDADAVRIVEAHKINGEMLSDGTSEVYAFYYDKETDEFFLSLGLYYRVNTYVTVPKITADKIVQSGYYNYNNYAYWVPTSTYQWSVTGK